MKLKIASLNIHNGRDVQHDFRILAKDILNSGADVVGLQEIDENTKRNKKQDTLAILSEYTGWKYYCYAPTISPFSEGEYGIAILSKYPILEWEYKKLPYKTETEEKRNVIYAKLDVDGTVLHFFNTHCAGNSIDIQLACIREWIGDRAPYVVTGDYNCEDFAIFHEKFPDAHLAIDEENPVKTSGGNRMIDNLILSPEVKLDSMYLIGMVNMRHSDHNMPVGVVTVENQ